jgi:hypothetical protein
MNLDEGGRTGQRSGVEKEKGLYKKYKNTEDHFQIHPISYHVILGVSACQCCIGTFSRVENAEFSKRIFSRSTECGQADISGIFKCSVVFLIK